jgi:hypothetical protein
LCGIFRRPLRRFTFLTLRTLAVTLGLTLPVLALLLFAALVDFALRLAQQSGVVFGVLLEVFSCHTVITQLGIARQLVVFLDNLLRRAAYFAFRSGTVENTVYDISALIIRPAAVSLGAGP